MTHMGSCFGGGVVNGGSGQVSLVRYLVSGIWPGMYGIWYPVFGQVCSCDTQVSFGDPEWVLVLLVVR